MHICMTFLLSVQESHCRYSASRKEITALVLATQVSSTLCRASAQVTKTLKAPGMPHVPDIACMLMRLILLNPYCIPQLVHPLPTADVSRPAKGMLKIVRMKANMQRHRARVEDVGREVLGETPGCPGSHGAQLVHLG